MIVLVVLQNAYQRGRLRSGYHPSTWLAELRGSRSGTRLREALPIGAVVRFANASPTMGRTVDSKTSPCARYLRRRIRDARPDVVLACGRVAEATVCSMWRGPLVAVPHPAHRLLTNDLLHRARELLGASTRIALRQRRGHYDQEQLP